MVFYSRGGWSDWGEGDADYADLIISSPEPKAYMSYVY